MVILCILLNFHVFSGYPTQTLMKLCEQQLFSYILSIYNKEKIFEIANIIDIIMLYSYSFDDCVS